MTPTLRRRYGRVVQLTPRYDGPPVLVVDVPLDDPAIPLLRQRRRLHEVLAGLDEDQWAVPSRCAGWSAQDVVAHLIGTNQYWAISFRSGLAGEPTRYLASFDPAATPPQMVEPMRAMGPPQVLDLYAETVDALAAVVTDLDDDAWQLLAEAPPGHVAMRAVALHALWDAWIHERDIVLPLELDAAVELDEVQDCLLYAAAIGPALLASTGSSRVSTLEVVATNPEISFVVEAGPTVVIREGSGAPAPDGPRLSGDAVTLIEGLTFRAPFDHGLAPEHVWLLGSLGEVFDIAVASTS